LSKAVQYQPLIVAYRNGAAVHLSDVADVQDSVEDLRNAGIANGKRAVLIILYRQPAANIIETVDRVRELIPQLQASVPAAINLSVVLDRTTTIRASLRDVEITLMISIGLVILVVFVFLRDLRSTVIPSVAVPVSLIGTFGVMYLCGYSLDNLSLMALTIATGFVVDDAIVVLENVSRHMEEGMSPMAAAMRGAKEVGFTVLSMSASLVAVFIPILLMGGMVGRLFREFAVTLSVAIVISLVISLTATPMMCARVLKQRTERPRGRLYRASETVFDWVLGRYEVSLSWALRHSRFMMLIMFATIGLNFYLFAIVPKGFFPQQDTGRLKRFDPGCTGHFVHGDAAEAGRPGRYRATGPCGGKCAWLHRRGIRRHPQYRPRVRLAQAAGRAQDKCRSGDCAAARQTVRCPGCDSVSAGGAGRPYRRAPEQCAVPVHAARPESAGAHLLGTAHPPAPAFAPGAGRPQQRSARQGNEGHADHRP
jgi:hypothetical protein